MGKIRIPARIQFKIYLSILITVALFISVYVALFYVGGFVAEWWETPELINQFGWVFVGIGLIPLVIALFISSKDHGHLIKEESFPKLVKLVEKVADDLGVKRPDEIHLLPTDEIYVTGLFKRKLGIGIIALRALTKEEFESILAHEYGHLYGNDTIVGAILSKIQISLDKSSKFGKAWWDYIPFAEFAIIGLAITGFSKAYTFLFNIILSIHSRQVEYRADYIASHITSKENFAKALINYSAYTIYFNQIGYDYMIQLLQQNQQFLNIYESIHKAYEKENKEKIKKAIFENDKAGIFSSHPSLKGRLRALGFTTINPKQTGKHTAIAVIDKPKMIEEEMTRILTDNIHVNLLYADAVQREGRCRFCGDQFEKLDELLDHEENCKEKSN